MLSTLRTRAAARKAESGFSLIELLIVMVIIAILVLIAIPAISQYRTNARVAAVQSDARNVGTQVEGQYTLTQTYDAVDTKAELTALVRLSNGVEVVNVTKSAAGDRVRIDFDHTAVGGTSDEFSYVTDLGVVKTADAPTL